MESCKTLVVNMKKFQCIIIIVFISIHSLNDLSFFGSSCIWITVSLIFLWKIRSSYEALNNFKWRRYSRTFLSLILKNSAGMPSDKQIDNKIRAPILHTLFSWARAVILFLRFSKANPKIFIKKKTIPCWSKPSVPENLIWKWPHWSRYY